MIIYPNTLNQNSVSVILDVNSMLVKAYVNTAKDREVLTQEVDTDTLNEVFEVWGESPTLEDIDYTITEE